MIRHTRSPTKAIAKKVAGVFLVLWGLFALVTPFTPGSLLIFVGLELLGIRLLFAEKIKDKIRNWKKEK